MRMKDGSNEEMLAEVLKLRAENRTDEEPCIECEWLEMIVWIGGKIQTVKPERPHRSFFVETLRNLPGVIEDRKNVTDLELDFEESAPVLLPGEKIDPKDAG